MTATLAMAFLLWSPGAPTICIDPGHPSEVGMGTRGKKLTEVQAVWDVGKELRSRLQAKGYRVVMTKASVKEKVINRRRAEIANASRADLMVRLHCDAASGSGFTVYYPSQQGKSNGVKGPAKDVLSHSKAVAGTFHSAMAKALSGKLKDNGLKTDLATYIGGKQGALTGSIFSKVPVLLVEMVVLTNPKDEAFLASATGRAAMVDALTKGVVAAVPPR